MNEDIIVPALFFATVIILALGIPLVRVFTRRQELRPANATLSPDLTMRLDRIESMVETVAVEVERLSEGQRFTTRLLSERAVQPVVQEAPVAVPVAHVINAVTHA